MIDRTQIIAGHPLVETMEARGITLRGTGDKLTTNRCATTEHKAGHLCVNVNRESGLWYCNDCQQGGSVIDFLAGWDGITPADVLKRLGGSNAAPPPQKAATTPPARSNGAGKMVKAYDYTDENGKLLFQVCRFEPKDFRQRAPDGKNGWVYSLEGVRRVLYNLPAVLKADTVFLCEGEKDADTMNAAGFVATTNCGGAKKWDASYSESLRKKDVVLLPDNDKAGAEHRDALKAALAPVAGSMRIVEMPEGFKDVSEYVASFPNHADGMHAVLDLCERAELLYRGESVPVQTMAELEVEYRESVQKSATHRLPLGSWLPSLGQCVRPLVPGELFTILAGTGCGKTMILQNIALNTSLATLLFEAELPGTLSFERFAAMATKSSGGHVESTYRMNGTVDWKTPGKLDHIVCCHLSRLTPDKIKRVIEAAQLKTCVRPVLVLIDYIQLIQGDGSSRYERTSCVAEQLKVVAKETNTIIVVASQIGRASTGKDVKETREVSLTDGKDSGSIENSSGLVLGAWRDADDANRLWLRVLKNTKGTAGRTIPCRIAESLLIHEEATPQ